MFDPTGIIGNGNRDQDELRPPVGDIGNGNRKRRASANLNAMVDKDEYGPPRPRVIANGDRKRRANATP